MGGGQGTASPGLRVQAELNRSLQERGSGGGSASTLGAGGRSFELSCDLLIRATGRLRQVPGAAIGITVGIGYRRQGSMDLLAVDPPGPLLRALERRTPHRRRRTAHPDRRERRDLVDPHGDRLRDRAPRRDRRAPRPTHHRTARTARARSDRWRRLSRGNAGGRWAARVREAYAPTRPGTRRNARERRSSGRRAGAAIPRGRRLPPRGCGR